LIHRVGDADKAKGEQPKGTHDKKSAGVSRRF